MPVASPDIPAPVARAFAADPRIVRVRHYESGWVPNAYKWRAPGTGTEYEVMPEGWITDSPFGYDRKRPYGRSPVIVGYSTKGGRLYSA